MGSRVASDATRDLLRVGELPGVGAVTLRKIAIAARANAEVDILRATSIVVPQARMSDSSLAKAAIDADQVVCTCDGLDITILSLLDDNYPKALARISDAPPLLFIRGQVSSIASPGVAVVGTRKASEQGRRAARLVAQYLAQKRVPVVSGLAFGIDAAAHQGALDAGGVTIAVLAHGLDTVSPAAHKDLAAQIINTGGALVSEHPPGTPAHRPEFVRRNRIQSGLSRLSVIVESGKEGGAIHQAKFTHDQGRPILVIWPERSAENAGSFDYSGAEHLIEAMGARPISRVGDLQPYLQECGDPGAADEGLKGRVS